MSRLNLRSSRNGKSILKHSMISRNCGVQDVLQELSKKKIGWDEPLEGELKSMWQKVVAGLQYISLRA